MDGGYFLDELGRNPERALAATLNAEGAFGILGATHAVSIYKHASDSGLSLYRQYRGVENGLANLTGANPGR